jgi:plastocyanin
MRMKPAICTTLFAAATLLGACGGGSDGVGGSGSCTPGQTASIDIQPGGVKPSAVCVLPGGSVTFKNSDTATHDIESGSTCTPLDLGVIPPSESRTATLPTVAVCSFHDALNASNGAFDGTVAVTQPPATGPGY